MLNEKNFQKVFGAYSERLQKIILNDLYDLNKIEVFGLSPTESKILREYLGISVKPRINIHINSDGEIPAMAKISRKSFYGIIKQKHIIKIDEAKNNLSNMIDITDLEQLKTISSYTTGELMNMYGISAYPLINLCKEHGIYPLPDLAPNGSIRPFYSCTEAKFSIRTVNALGGGFCKQFGWKQNLACLVCLTDDEILRIRNIGKVLSTEIRDFKEMFKQQYPVHYEKLIQLADGIDMRYFEYYSQGSSEEFEEFKKECEIRKLIDFDDEDCLMKVESCTESELRLVFGSSYDVLEMKCKRLGIYPLPEMDLKGNIIPNYLFGGCRSFNRFYSGSDCLERFGVQYAYELFTLNDSELDEFFMKLSIYERVEAILFVARTKERYPNHIERLKEIKKTREKKYGYKK